MKKVAIVAGVAIAMLALPGAVALADHSPANEANNSTQCNNVEGTFTSGDPNTCEWDTVVVGDPEPFAEDTKVAGKSGRAWKAEGTKTTTTTTENTTTKGTGPGEHTSEETVEESVEVTDCKVPGGQSKKDTSHQFCQPSS